MEKLWKCKVCGYVYMGEEPPANCPKCGVTSDNFVQLDDEAAGKIYASDRTNDIHEEIIALSMKIARLAEEGIGLNLDPNCVKVFEKTCSAVWNVKQLCRAELAGHMSKGKYN